jgi:hypothetical protein
MWGIVSGTIRISVGKARISPGPGPLSPGRSQIILRTPGLLRNLKLTTFDQTHISLYMKNIHYHYLICFIANLINIKCDCIK